MKVTLILVLGFCGFSVFVHTHNSCSSDSVSCLYFSLPFVTTVRSTTTEATGFCIKPLPPGYIYLRLNITTVRLVNQGNSVPR